MLFISPREKLNLCKKNINIAKNAHKLIPYNVCIKNPRLALGFFLSTTLYCIKLTIKNAALANAKKLTRSN